VRFCTFHACILTSCTLEPPQFARCHWRPLCIQGSIPVYLAFMAWSGGGTAGYFGGWTVVAWLVALLGAAGGLLVALSIKYGDAILKTLATTASIILSSVLEWWWLDGVITPVMVIAGVQVVLAICNYTFDPTPPSHGATVPSSSSSSVSEAKKELSKLRPEATNDDRNQDLDDDNDDDANEGIPLMEKTQHR
jgi:Nucleotide-sugar transporter